MTEAQSPNEAELGYFRARIIAVGESWQSGREGSVTVPIRFDRRLPAGASAIVFHRHGSKKRIKVWEAMPPEGTTYPHRGEPTAHFHAAYDPFVVNVPVPHLLGLDVHFYSEEFPPELWSES